MKYTVLLKLSVLFRALLVLGCFISPLIVQAEAIWIDVRSAAEYEVNHIDEDIRITHTEILKNVEKLFPNKDTEINLYCRSGNRAGQAKAVLEAAGYKNIINAGGIDDAKKARGL